MSDASIGDGIPPGIEPRTEDGIHRYRTLPAGERRPPIVDLLAEGSTPELVWRNELGGQTWRLGDRYLKWSSDAAGIDLHREVVRLRWLEGRHPVPRVLDEGHDNAGRWFLTSAIRAESAVADRWRSDPERAVRGIAIGLRRLHSLPVADVPTSWRSWATRTPAELGSRPAIDDPVVVHGDACAPNTLLDADGHFAANVDLGDVTVADRWADLAVASMALEWNYGPGWEPCFFAAYGIRPDPICIEYYRALWDAES